MTINTIWPNCAEPACGHAKTNHNKATVQHECQVCTCQGYVPKMSAGTFAELTQLRAKVEVYEVRNETQVSAIETLKKQLNGRDAAIDSYRINTKAQENVISELKEQLGATRFLVALLRDAGALPEGFARTFMPEMPDIGEDDEGGYFEGEVGDGVIAIHIVADEG